MMKSIACFLVIVWHDSNHSPSRSICLYTVNMVFSSLSYYTWLRHERQGPHSFSCCCKPTNKKEPRVRLRAGSFRASCFGASLLQFSGLRHAPRILGMSDPFQGQLRFPLRRFLFSLHDVAETIFVRNCRRQLSDSVFPLPACCSESSPNLSK